MAKSSKSPTPEFLAKRRKTIVEMAMKRRKEKLLRASGISIQDSSKIVSSVSLAGSPPATSQS